MTTEAEHIPFGTEWRKEMMKFTKHDLIDHLRNALIEGHKLKSDKKTKEKS